MAYHCWFQEKMCHNVWLTDIINFLLEFVVFWLVHSVLSMITLWTLNWRYMVNDFTGFRWVNFSFFLRKENISIERIWARLKATYSTWSISPGRSTRWFVVADPSKKGGYPVIDLEQNLPLIPFQTQINHKLPLLFLF